MGKQVCKITCYITPYVTLPVVMVGDGEGGVMKELQVLGEAHLMHHQLVPSSITYCNSAPLLMAFA